MTRLMKPVAFALATLTGSALAQTDHPSQAQAVAAGLARQMAISAQSLEAGERHAATQALDRALHLAEFAEGSSAATGDRAFRGALETVQSARHELQMGRPEDASRALMLGAAALKELPVGLELTGLDPDRLEDVEGLSVLNVHGQHMGEITGFGKGDRGAVAAVEHGDFIFFGGETTAVPADRLLAGGGYVVIPEDLRPGDFGS